jgi:thiamine biosynthesis lipoprotein
MLHPLTRFSFALAATVSILAASASCGPREADRGPQLLREQRLLMGTTFDIQVVTDDRERGALAIREAFDEVARVEDLLSEWRETSEISRVNRLAGREPVAIGPDLFAVVERSLWVSEATRGAFDVTFAGCGRLWSFVERRKPSDEALSRCLGAVGYRRLELDPDDSTLFLPRADMRIGIAGIGKGYGVDRAAQRLESRGIRRYVVDGGGDIRLRGANVDRPWSVGIAHPRERGTLFAALQLDGGSIVTSGDYQRFFDLEGVRYHDILDPATGLPARGSIAITVIAPTAMDADALATGLFVLGPDRGLSVVEGLAGVEALFFDADAKVRPSSGFPAYRPIDTGASQ